jgi:DNA-binding CsgD family transcriptional regulator
MTALQVLRELPAQLSLASTGEDVGRVLLSVAKRFGMTTALIVDMTKLFNRIGPAIVYSSTDRAAIEVFDAARPFAEHPFLVHAGLTERPATMSYVRKQSIADGEEGWWAGLPAHMRNTDGFIVPVHEKGVLAWYTAFSGRHPDLGARAQSLLSAAVYAGFVLFHELMDATAPRSPLSPREAECLRWVAEGKTDIEVGMILDISPRTVRFHINNAKVKLGVATRIQAVAKRASGIG